MSPRSLPRFCRAGGIKAHEEGRVLDALKRHQDQNVHFADAYLAASAANFGVAVASFDRDLEKFKDVTRYEPEA